MVLHCHIYCEIALCALIALCISQSHLRICLLIHPHASVSQSMCSFKNELWIFLRKPCCRQLLSFNLLLICLICPFQLNSLLRYCPRYLVVSLCSSTWFSMYIFIVSSAPQLLPIFKTISVDFLTLTINFFSFSQSVISFSEALILSSSFLQFLFDWLCVNFVFQFCAVLV